MAVAEHNYLTFDINKVPKQLYLFQPTKEQLLMDEIDRMNKKLDKQRRCQFAKIGHIEKISYELSERLDILERNICSTGK